MRALKLIQHMRANGEQMSRAVVQKITISEKCSQLVLNVTAEEQRRSSLEIYQDLTDWLATADEAPIKERYVTLGMRRAQQGVPFTHLYWAVCIAHEHLWEYIQQECLLDEAVDFWGGVKLLYSLTKFFDRALYFTLVGYHQAGKAALIGAPAA